MKENKKHRCYSWYYVDQFGDSIAAFNNMYLENGWWSKFLICRCDRCVYHQRSDRRLSDRKSNGVTEIFMGSVYWLSLFYVFTAARNSNDAY